MADASANADADMADREAETPQPTVEECCDEPRAAGAVEFSGADAPICVIMLHGNTVDIANTDIDFVLLEALLGAREEVLNHNIRDPRCSNPRILGHPDIIAGGNEACLILSRANASAAGAASALA
ncbi:E3 ubiquitin-protein ligase tom1 [Paramarasmius palmivorus]|uniref:E3 ubiquitin-protein ligase tom1 n=1 Tax=Paramarasmius palmivorus TaxID=297713 RepID=A0AAW0C0K0_9AGAR